MNGHETVNNLYLKAENCLKQKTVFILNDEQYFCNYLYISTHIDLTQWKKSVPDFVERIIFL